MNVSPGKSTLAKVLTGLYDYEGSLLIDGVEARTYQRQSLHQYMTVCPQNFAVFPLSLRENVGIGEVGEIDNDAAIMNAVQRGGAEEVVQISGLDSTLVQASKDILNLDFISHGIQQNATPNMMIWDTPGKRGKVIGSATPVISRPKDEKVEKLGEAKDSSDKATPETRTPVSAGDQDQEKEPVGVPSPPMNKSPYLDASEPDSKDIKKSGLRSHKEPTYVSLSGGQMQRVAISRAFMRADQATLVVLE
jgi:ABC-type proline/glycine betaine transport system ATPase subunit